MTLSPRVRLLILMLFALALLVALIFIPNPTYAQAPTDTPTPSLTPTPPPTYTPYPYSGITGLIGTATNIPALSLTPKPWNTPTRPAPGAAFYPPTLVLGSADEVEQEHGFEAISGLNMLKLGGYLATVAVGFYGWWSANFPQVVKGLRIFSIIVFLMAVLYALFKRFAPDLVSAANTWRQGEPAQPETDIERAVSRVQAREAAAAERRRQRDLDKLARSFLGLPETTRKKKKP